MKFPGLAPLYAPGKQMSIMVPVTGAVLAVTILDVKDDVISFTEETTQTTGQMTFDRFRKYRIEFLCHQKMKSVRAHLEKIAKRVDSLLHMQTEFGFQDVFATEDDTLALVESVTVEFTAEREREIERAVKKRSSKGGVVKAEDARQRVARMEVLQRELRKLQDDIREDELIGFTSAVEKAEVRSAIATLHLFLFREIQEWENAIQVLGLDVPKKTDD